MGPYCVRFRNALFVEHMPAVKHGHSEGFRRIWQKDRGGKIQDELAKYMREGYKKNTDRGFCHIDIRPLIKQLPMKVFSDLHTGVFHKSHLHRFLGGGVLLPCVGLTLSYIA